MKRILSIIALLAAVGYGLQSCSSGAYQANPSSNANGSINPLKPLTAKQFTWTGTGAKVSLNINGAPWSTDSASIFWYDSLQTNIVFASGGGKVLIMYIKAGWANNVYNMGYKQYDYLAQWADDSATFVSPGLLFQSALGNSGELYMTANDTLHFDGKFYFQGANSKGQIDNITNGVFTLLKY
jgi:hypothetical protein